MAAYRPSRMQSILLLVVGALLALGLGLLTARGIVRSLYRVKAVCDALASGDLTRTSGLTSRDEPGRMGQALDAARAGEMGKGFAVVASEVKDLAQETARATEDISHRVEAIQADTTGAVTASEEITRVIARINDFQTTIASAVEEQTATTAEMNRSVSEAATGTSDIALNITGVAEAARLTSEDVTQSQQATAELARLSSDLKALVTRHREYLVAILTDGLNASWRDREAALLDHGEWLRFGRPGSLAPGFPFSSPPPAQSRPDGPVPAPRRRPGHPGPPARHRRSGAAARCRRDRRDRLRGPRTRAARAVPP